MGLVDWFKGTRHERLDAVAHPLSEGGSGDGPNARGPRPRAAAAFAARMTFEGVERHYGDHHALRGVSLDVEAGELVCLLGPSGCGKTTLLRIASGVEQPTGGRVLLNTHEVAGPRAFVPPERRNVGLMFQEFALFPHLKIIDNVAFGLRSLPRVDQRREALAALARVGLEAYAEQFPHVLSGGQQQRVALARAIVPRPAVMLMDEPFSGLDVQLREAMQDETLALLRETRATSIIVTHAPDEAVRMADRIAVMREGRIVQVGRPHDLYRAPEDLFVARLFSQINEIAMRVVGGAVRSPIGTFWVPDLAEGETAILCIRRRAIRLKPSGEGLAARVVRARVLGDIALIELAVQGFDAPLETVVREGMQPQAGDELAIAVDPESVLIFPPLAEP
ncbi:MAG: ABC transporter ATP-binding protein [Pseudomonadota bacterium]